MSEFRIVFARCAAAATRLPALASVARARPGTSAGIIGWNSVRAYKLAFA